MNIPILNLKLELVLARVSVMADGGEILPESSQSMHNVVQIVYLLRKMFAEVKEQCTMSFKAE